MKKFKEYFKPVQEKEELKEEVLEEAVYWQVLIPGISTVSYTHLTLPTKA